MHNNVLNVHDLNSQISQFLVINIILNVCDFYYIILITGIY